MILFYAFTKYFDYKGYLGYLIHSGRIQYIYGFTSQTTDKLYENDEPQTTAKANIAKNLKTTKINTYTQSATYTKGT